MECKKERNLITHATAAIHAAKKESAATALHRIRRAGELPACYFPDDMESGYDRSVENFIRIYRERGISWN